MSAGRGRWAKATPSCARSIRTGRSIVTRARSPARPRSPRSSCRHRATLEGGEAMLRIRVRELTAALALVFFLSGAAGLVYESIWSRYLGLFVGHSAYAQIIVLVIFLGGMSIGALLVGRHTERLRKPLLWYAAVEFATGVIGLMFHDVFTATTGFAYSPLFHEIEIGRAPA